MSVFSCEKTLSVEYQDTLAITVFAAAYKMLLESPSHTGVLGIILGPFALYVTEHAPVVIEIPKIGYGVKPEIVKEISCASALGENLLIFGIEKP